MDVIVKLRRQQMFGIQMLSPENDDELSGHAKPFKSSVITGCRAQGITSKLLDLSGYVKMAL